MRINFNITVMDMPCEFATIDVVDILGTRSDNVTKNVHKWHVDESGVRKGFEGRNLVQKDLLHDEHHDLAVLHANGMHAVPMENEMSFNNHINHHQYTFANFYAPWCIWCQRLEPVWEAFAESVEMAVEDVPAYLATFEGAVQSACWFWETNNLNQWADKGDILTLTKRINGGTIGLEDRIKHYEHALHVFGA
jgi:hypothetical protein